MALARLNPVRTSAFVLALVLACTREPTAEPEPAAPALTATAPARVDALCAESARAWSVLADGGASIATSRGACLGPIEHPEDGRLWHFVAQLQRRGEPRPSWELHTWLDDAGAPRYAEYRTPELVTRFAWRDGALVVRRLGDQLTIAEAGQLWVTPGHGVYLRELMLRLGVGVGGEPERVVQRGFVPERDTIATLELSLERLGADRARAQAGASVLVLEGVDRGLAGLEVAMALVEDAPIYRPSDEAQLAASLPARPRPRYAVPEGLQLIPVEVPAQGEAARLAGELVVAGEVSQPRPAVLFLGGAGPQDRHGIVPDSSVDIGSHELHDALAAAGFAVLRVDDRGVGDSGIGLEPNPGFASLVDDGRRALAVLAARPEVDPARIVVIGHGEGALIASILASERVRVRGRARRVAGLVLLAGPGRNLRELVYDEIRASMVGQREGAIRAAVDRARRVHDAALTDGDLPASNEGARRWMVEAFAEDPLARLVAVRAPVLAVQGGKDFQVSPERDFEPIRAHVESRAAKGSEALLMPELDHLFKREPGISTPGHYADLRRHVDAVFIARVVGWCLGVVDDS